MMIVVLQRQWSFATLIPIFFIVYTFIAIFTNFHLSYLKQVLRCISQRLKSHAQGTRIQNRQWITHMVVLREDWTIDMLRTVGLER